MHQAVPEGMNESFPFIKKEIGTLRMSPLCRNSVEITSSRMITGAFAALTLPILPIAEADLGSRVTKVASATCSFINSVIAVDVLP